jgi:hypothetical protein
MDAFADFREIWLCDFEFTAPPGERPTPVCMVAREYRTGRTLRLWADVLANLPRPPFAVGPDVLFVAYFASAELGCFQNLSWAAPARVLDLYAEFRCRTSGLTVPCGHGLLGALSWYGLDGLGRIEKESMRELAQRGEPYSAEERAVLLAYCETDVNALARLLQAMLPRIDLPRALLRGRYMAAVAQMERAGTPLDTQALAILRTNWTAIQDRLIERIDAGRGIYVGRTFKAERFAAWLIEQGIPWPRLASGALDLSDDCFHEMARAYPDKVSPIRELRQALSFLRLEKLSVGSDGRNRCLLSPFASRTGRNQPSNSAYIFGPSTWLRGLIRPAVGYALAYVDWEQQEFGIAAALSGDAAMMRAYGSGDPYLAFAKQARAVPLDGTLETHKAERERFKVLSLAVQYGMGTEALGRKLDEAPARGRELIGLHRETYPRYWQWSDAVEMTGMLSGLLQATFGWTVHVGPDANPRSLRNFPLQANGAEMLRIACILATERGIRVCAPIHDALLIEAPIDEIADAVSATQTAMRHASEMVLAGFPLRTDAKIVRYPDRYSDPRGERFWHTVWELICEQTRTTDGTPTRTTHEPKPVPPVTPPPSFLFLPLVSKEEMSPNAIGTTRPGSVATAARNDGSSQAEAPADLEGRLSHGPDPMGLDHAGNGATRPRPGRRIGDLARGSLSKCDDSSADTGAVVEMRHPSQRRAESVSDPGSCGPDFDSPTSGPRPGTDRPAAGGREGWRDMEIDAADIVSEQEAIQLEGCTRYTPAELAELGRSLKFP